MTDREECVSCNQKQRDEEEAMTKPADGQIAKARERYARAEKFFDDNYDAMDGLDDISKAVHFAESERQAVIEECAKVAKPAAESITKIVDIWLEKINLPTSNKEGKQIFTQTLQDVIELAIRSMGE